MLSTVFLLCYFLVFSSAFQIPWYEDMVKMNSSAIAPKKRDFHSMEYLNGKIYIIGGMIQVDEQFILPQDSYWVYDFRVWEEFSTGSPPTRIMSLTTNDGENIYIFGGSIYDGEIFSHTNELWRYNTITRTWNLMETTGHVPKPDTYFHMTYMQNKLILFAIDENLELDLDTLEWTRVTKITEPIGWRTRCDHEVPALKRATPYIHDEHNIHYEHERKKRTSLKRTPLKRHAMWTF